MLEILRAFVGIPRGVPTHRTERHSSQLSADVFILSRLRSTQNSICSGCDSCSNERTNPWTARRVGQNNDLHR